MKIAILGGRFDPPHIGHILIARQILDYRKDIDKVIFVPAYKHKWKPITANNKDRLEMLQLCLEDKMEISEIEIERKGISYAIDTIRAIKKQTNAQIYWIVGADILSEFHKWTNTKDLLKEATFLVFPRDPYKIPKRLPKGFELVADPKLLITSFSSTFIRGRIKRNFSIKYLVPEKVEKYIKEHNLYV
jgi:nicotinate-nucleotide adenylyltransferase